MHPACRQKSSLESPEMQSQLAMLRGRISEDICEQLPFLKGVAFVLDQLASSSSRTVSTMTTASACNIEQVCYLQVRIRSIARM